MIELNIMILIQRMVLVSNLRQLFVETEIYQTYLREDDFYDPIQRRF